MRKGDEIVAATAAYGKGEQVRRARAKKRKPVAGHTGEKLGRVLNVHGVWRLGRSSWAIGHELEQQGAVWCAV